MNLSTARQSLVSLAATGNCLSGILLVCVAVLPAFGLFGFHVPALFMPEPGDKLTAVDLLLGVVFAAIGIYCMRIGIKLFRTPESTLFPEDGEVTSTPKALKVFFWLGIFMFAIYFTKLLDMVV